MKWEKLLQSLSWNNFTLGSLVLIFLFIHLSILSSNFFFFLSLRKKKKSFQVLALRDIEIVGRESLCIGCKRRYANWTVRALEELLLSMWWNYRVVIFLPVAKLRCFCYFTIALLVLLERAPNNLRMNSCTDLNLGEVVYKSTIHHILRFFTKFIEFEEGRCLIAANVHQ